MSDTTPEHRSDDTGHVPDEHELRTSGSHGDPLMDTVQGRADEPGSRHGLGATEAARPGEAPTAADSADGDAPTEGDAADAERGDS